MSDSATDLNIMYVEENLRKSKSRVCVKNKSMNLLDF